MQVITITTTLSLLLLLLLSVAEAGFIKARRTETPGPQTHAATSSTAFPAEMTIFASSSSPTSITTINAMTTATTRTTLEDLRHNIGAESAANPEITTASVPDPEGPDASGPQRADDGIKFVQTTYWACVAKPRETHCGWHEPILDVSSSSATAVTGQRGGGERIALRAGLVAACGVAVLALAL